MRDFYIICYLFDRLLYFVQTHIVVIFVCAFLAIGLYLFVRLEYAAMQNDTIDIDGIEVFCICSIYDLLNAYRLNNGTLFGRNQTTMYVLAKSEGADEDTDEDADLYEDEDIDGDTPS